MSAQPPLIAHVIFRLSTGGMENGLVNLINELPRDRFRHAIISLTDADAFARRIRRDDVTIVQLAKREGQDWGLYARLWRAFRRLRPAIVHSRNLAAIESQVPARLSGCRATVHSEHGWDIHDPDGSNRKYQLLRRAIKPMVSHFIALSRQLEGYLSESIRVPANKLTRICNGVDCARYRPPKSAGWRCPELAEFAPPGTLLIGTVGRMQAIKDQLNLTQAFIELCHSSPKRDQLRLALIGDGPLREKALALLGGAGLNHLAWLPGSRVDIPQLLRSLDVFVLPSLAEGISNTLLEAMASGRPCIATAVGGNKELVVPDQTGLLVPAADSPALARAIACYVEQPALLAEHGRQARARAEQEYSFTKMVDAYAAVYDRVLTQR